MAAKPTSYERWERARQLLAHQILTDTAEAGSSSVVELEAGRLPPDLERRILAYAPARASAMTPTRGLTKPLAVWLNAATGHYSATGEAPSVSELARRVGKSRTAAHAAMRRLRDLGRWPGEAAP